jgi:hypothetical protein
MKKYTCPECGEVFYDKKPRVCKKCGCPSKEFQVVELVEVPVNEPAPAPQPAPQAAPQPAQQPAQQPTYVAPQPAQEPYRIVIGGNGGGVPMTIERFEKALSVLFLLAGIAFGLYVLIQGCIDVSEVNKYRSWGEPRESAAKPVLLGLFIVLLSFVQFGLIRLFVKISNRLENIEKKA